MTEYEYCLLGHHNKCTTEWGLLSFLPMQSQTNEHPLHKPSRTWPSLSKTLQRCGVPYHSTIGPLDSLLEPAVSGLHHCSSYLWLFVCLTERKERSSINSWQEPTSDFPARICTMTSSAAILFSAASEPGGPPRKGLLVFSLSAVVWAAPSDVASFIDDARLWASTSILRLSETVWIKQETILELNTNNTFQAKTEYTQ